MGKIPLVAKLGEKVEVKIYQSPATASHATSSWHLPFWSGDYELVVSPPWVMALGMIALGLGILVWSGCRMLRRRKAKVLGEKRKKRVRMISYPWMRMSSRDMV